MKKIFTLMTGILITLVTFADNRPTVTVRSTKNYEIVIDGKSYFSKFGNVMNLTNLQRGKHTVKVYELNSYMFRTTRKLVSTSGFRLNNKDVSITVDTRGNLRIVESKFGRGYDGRDDDWGRNSDDRDGRDGRDGRAPGRGNRF